MTEPTSKMPRPWFRASNYAAAIFAILASAESMGLDPQAPDERRLGRFVLPPFQRPAVWTEAQKVRFIESIWAGLPLGCYVYNQPQTFRSPYDQWLLDGQQRITAILDYVADQFPVHGYLWRELTKVDQRVFQMTPMACLETRIEDEVQLREVYDRLAYGGTAHAPKNAMGLEESFAQAGEMIHTTLKHAFNHLENMDAAPVITTSLRPLVAKGLRARDAYPEL